jgi:hypothetical protein
MAESKWQEACSKYNKAHAKIIASGYATLCPYCGGGTGATENRLKKGDGHRMLRCCCFTCWSIYGRRYRDGKLYDRDGKVLRVRKNIGKARQATELKRVEEFEKSRTRKHFKKGR